MSDGYDRGTFQTDLQGNRLRAYRWLGCPVMRPVPGEGWSP